MRTTTKKQAIVQSIDSMNEQHMEQVIGFIAVLLGAGNAVGGYVVTERMLEMFKPSKKDSGEG